MRTPAPRGFTIIESFVALTVLAVGLLGLAALQIVAARSNNFGRRLAQASQLARDLAENVERWDFNDSRLAALQNVSSTTDPAITSRWDLGRAATIPSTSAPQFGEVPGDTNATNPGALGTNYTGLSGDVTGTGVYDFNRYWTVYGLDLNSTGTPQGKLVQIVVRWKEPRLGERQITLSTYKPNPAASIN
jgi:type IV pilus modification protein PilV